MKKAGIGIGIFIAAFAGVFVALRIDRVIERNGVITQLSDGKFVPIEPVQYQQGSPFDFRAAAKKVIPSVVSVDKIEAIRDWFTDETSYQNTGSGSGVIISDDGYVVTNNHVVANATRITIRLSDGKSYEAKLVGTDPRSDLAVVKIQGGGKFQAAELADSSKVEIGQWVMAVGNPLGYDGSLSVGVVSSLNRTLTAGQDETVLTDTIQTDASINRGNSGGALTNDKGQVIGINSAIASPSGGSVGIGFAIPVNRVKKTTTDLLKLGRVPYGDPGFAIYRFGINDPSARRSYRNITEAEPPAKGVIVARLWQGPAQQAGIQRFSVVTKVDNKPINEPIDWTKAMLDKRVGDKVTLSIWSNGTTKNVTLTLADDQVN